MSNIVYALCLVRRVLFTWRSEFLAGGRLVLWARPVRILNVLRRSEGNGGRRHSLKDDQQDRLARMKVMTSGIRARRGRGGGRCRTAVGRVSGRCC